MIYCASCKEPFLPGDEIDLGTVELPGAIAALSPLVRPYLSRLTLHRCTASGCRGMVTALYLPRTAPGIGEPAKTGGVVASGSALPV